MKNARLLVVAILGCVFIYASLSKIASPFRFATVIQSYQLVPERLISLLAIAIPWLELLCGVAILVAALQRASAWILCGLSIALALAISQALSRGLDLDCGCFAGPSKIGWGHVAFDLILAALAAWLAMNANRAPVALAAKENASKICRALVACQLVGLAVIFNASSVAHLLSANATRIQIPVHLLQATCLILAIAVVFQRGNSTVPRTALFALLIPLALGLAATFSKPRSPNQFATAFHALDTLQKRGFEEQIEAAVMDLDFRHHPQLFANELDIDPVANGLETSWSSTDYFDSVNCRIVDVKRMESGSKTLQAKYMVEGHTMQRDGTLGHLRMQMELAFDMDRSRIVSWAPVDSSETIHEGSSLPGWRSGQEVDSKLRQIQIQMPPQNDRLLVFLLPRIGEIPDPPFELPDGVRVYSTYPTKVAHPVPDDISLAALKSVFHSSALYRSTGGAFVSDANGRVLWISYSSPSLSRLRQLLAQVESTVSE